MAITYDDIGNPLSYNNGSAYTFTWDGRELASVVKGGVTTSYTYGADGLRTQKQYGSITYNYYYVDGQLVRMTWANSYIDFLYDESGSVYSFVYDGDQYYFVKNLQGDVVQIYSIWGTLLVEYDYDAWGNCTVVYEHSSYGDLAEFNPIRYRGYVYDFETGFYYLNNRYYDPQIKRFINSDEFSYLGADGDFASLNLYAYCGNNPIVRKDTQGYAAETVFDFISLGFSIADVIANPANPWAWAGLVGDIVDVAVPFVGGVGEVIKGVGAIDKTKDVVKAAKKAKSVVSDSVGTYEIIYKSGKNYVGKGTFDRAITSAMDHAKKIDLNDFMGDEVVSITWKRAKDSREAFMTEYMWQHRGSGVLSANKNANTYNKIWSPGRGYLGWD